MCVPYAAEPQQSLIRKWSHTCVSVQFCVTFRHVGTFVWSYASGSLWLSHRVTRPARRTRCGGQGALGQGSQLATTPHTSLRSLFAAAGLLPAHTTACLHGRSVIKLKH